MVVENLTLLLSVLEERCGQEMLVGFAVSRRCTGGLGALDPVRR